MENNEKKKCLDCGQLLIPEGNFYFEKRGNKIYYKSPCLRCLTIKRKEYRKTYLAKHGNAVRERARINAKERRKTDEKFQRSVKNSRLKFDYGITIKDYEILLKNQNYCCAICGIHEKSLTKRLFVDHCHKTNKVRGLLCNFCNSLLGMAKDDKTILNSAAKYLKNYE